MGSCCLDTVPQSALQSAKLSEQLHVQDRMQIKAIKTYKTNCKEATKYKLQITNYELDRRNADQEDGIGQQRAYTAEMP